MKRFTSLSLAALLSGVATCAFAQEAPPAPSPYLRVVEGDDGLKVALEVSVRRFEAPGRPVVFLASAVHIADRSFYKELQEFLDARDLVLFESVKPAGAGNYRDPKLTDDQRHKMAQRQVLFIAGAAELFRQENETYPRDQDDLLTNLPKDMSRLVRESLTDPWGNALTYVGSDGTCGRPEGYDISSLGADAQSGGEGADADITRSYPGSERIEIPTSDDGIQAKLADALGLTFQLSEMTHEGDNWRNSDLSIDEVVDRIDATGESGDALFESLAGDGFSSKVAGILLKLVKLSPSMQAMIKVMLVEILGNADGLMEAMPPEMQGLMDVLIQDRNDAVERDLELVIKNEPEIDEVAIIYGAGHLADLQRRLEALGYAPAGDTWLRAIDLDLTDTGMSARQVKQLRSMLKTTLDQQLKVMQRQRR